MSGRVAYGEVESGKLLLALATTVILGSESRSTPHHKFLTHDSGARKIWPCGGKRVLISGKIQ
jgi:hypothetical protein